MKNFLFLLVLFVVAIFLSGCTNESVCGDGVCDFLEQDSHSPYYCAVDCGELEFESVTISVVDSSNNPLLGAKISILDSIQNLVYSGTTNSSGEITTQLTPKDYVVRVVDLDGKELSSENINVVQGETNIKIIQSELVSTLNEVDCWSETISPHPICTLSDLDKIRTHLDWNYILMNDIDASETSNWDGGAGFEPIGNEATPFKGELNGNSKKISNLNINRPSTTGVGLFGNVKNGRIIKLGLIGVNLIGYLSVGGISGVSQGGTILNSFVKGNVTGTNYIGGITGAGYNSTLIEDSYSNANVTGIKFIGGIAGAGISSTLKNTYYVGSVIGNEHVGGITGNSLGGLNTTSPDNYWNQEINSSNLITSDAGTGKTILEMKNINTYFGWGMQRSYNSFNDGYPYLSWENGEEGTWNISVGPMNCYDLEENPIKICTLSDLNKVRNYLDKNYILMKDIDASETRNWNDGTGWEPIGNQTIAFKGNFNGNNFIINNLLINRPNEDYVGLFGVSNGNISNVNLAEISVIGKNYVGGLVGKKSFLEIVNCSVDGNIISTSSDSLYIGGLVGMSSAYISDSYSMGVVESKGSKNKYIGGLVGYQSMKNISNSYSFSGVYATGPNPAYTGGLVGYLDGGEITKSYSIGDVKSNGLWTGGLVGCLSNAGIISNSYARGNVNAATQNVGGLVGLQKGGRISNSYATGKLSVGVHKDTRGGLIGQVDSLTPNAIQERSYWDINNSNVKLGCGVGGKCTIDGKTTLEMKDINTFNSWDIELSENNLNNGYPHLNLENEGEGTWKIYGVCPTDDNPVCGVDEVTYQNECYAKYVGKVAIDYFGTCKPKLIDTNLTLDFYDSTAGQLINLTGKDSNLEVVLTYKTQGSTNPPLIQVKPIPSNPVTIQLGKFTSTELEQLSAQIKTNIKGYYSQNNTISSVVSGTTSLRVSTPTDPFADPNLPTHPISTCNELSRIREHSDWNYYLTKDIDCAEFGNFLPIPVLGSTTKTTIFDGKNHTILNLKIVDQPEYSGDKDFTSSLFKTIRKQTTIKDLKLKNISLSTPSVANSLYAAPLAYTVDSGNTNITNVSAENITFIANINSSSNSKNNFSGLVGNIGSQNNLQTITVNGSMNFVISGKTLSTLNVDFGGIAQSNSGSMTTVIFNTASAINFNASSSIGGIVVNTSGNITNATNRTHLTGGVVGGIATNQSSGTINNAKNYGNLNGTSVAGGLVGIIAPSVAKPANTAYLKNSTNSGTISGSADSNIAGVAGRMISYSTAGGYVGSIHVEGTCNSGRINDSSKIGKNQIAGKVGHTHCDNGCYYTDNSIYLKNILVSCSSDCFPVSSKRLDPNLCDCSGVRIDVPCNQTCRAKPVNCTDYACDSKETTSSFCLYYGKNCGSFTGLDDCGKSKTVNCGSCPTPRTCSSSNVCTNPAGSTSWTGAGSGAAACGALGRDCDSAWDGAGSRNGCNSTTKNGGTAICKSVLVGVGATWSNGGSGAAACGALGRDCDSAWDGAGSRNGCNSTTKNGGTAICKSVLVGVGATWSNGGSGAAACGALGRDCDSAWDGAGSRNGCNSTTKNGGTAICKSVLVGVGATWSNGGSGAAACGALGRDCDSAWDGAGSRNGCNSTTKNGGTAICKSVLVGVGATWSNGGSGAAACGALGRDCDSAWDGAGSRNGCNSTTKNGGTAICKSVLVGVGATWSGRGSGAAACGALGRDCDSAWDGAGSRNGCNSTTKNGGTAICE